MIDCNDGPETVGGNSHRAPFGVFFGDAHACNGFEFEMLTRAEFDYGDAVVVGIVLFFFAEEVGRGDEHVVGNLSSIFNIHDKL